ncbi:neurotransmitter-gated ion-channel ligand-binding domain-containing protein [Hyaloraphidium curvatum]|nr:neurotransmitter-gated ion-channel ligand-binding domain-containing protein [Hyaloraphidium curvatum]
MWARVGALLLGAAAFWPLAACFPDGPRQAGARRGDGAPRRGLRLLVEREADSDFEARGYSPLNATAQLQNVLIGPGSSYDASTRPSFGGPPDRLVVQLDINNLYAVEPVSSTFTVDISIKLRWTDPRLVVSPAEFPATNGSDYRFLGSQGMGNGIGPSHSVWTPDVYFANEVVVEPLDDIVKVQPYVGGVFWARHFLAQMTSVYNLANFPFDRQTLMIKVASYSFNSRQVSLEWDTDPVYPPISGEQFTQVAWTYESFSTSRTTYQPFADRPPHEALIFNLVVARKTGSAYIKTFLPLMILVALTTVSYWFSVDAVPERLGLSITLVLTIVSFYSSVTQGLPMVNYATLMDWYVFVAFLVSFFSLFEIALIHHFVKRESNHILATELDFFCRRAVLPFWALFNVAMLVQLPAGSFPWLWVLCGILMFLLLVINLWLLAYYVWKRYEMRLQLEKSAYGAEKLDEFGEYLAGSADIGEPGSFKRWLHDFVLRTTDSAFRALKITVPGERALKKMLVDLDGDGKADEEVVVEVSTGRTERDRIDRRSLEMDLAQARALAGDARRRGAVSSSAEYVPSMAAAAASAVPKPARVVY